MLVNVLPGNCSANGTLNNVNINTVRAGREVHLSVCFNLWLPCIVARRSDTRSMSSSVLAGRIMCR